MLLGRVMETGLSGTDATLVRPPPLYVSEKPVAPFIPFVCPFPADSSSGAPSAIADMCAGSISLGRATGAFSSMGESGGGGMSVPFVRESRGARAGSSNRLRPFP